MIHVMLTYIVSLGLCGRFRESDTFRHVFENVLRRCMSEGLVGGEGFAIDASVVRADANGQKKPCGWQTNPGYHRTIGASNRGESVAALKLRCA